MNVCLISCNLFERIYAWFEGEVIDRAPVRFSAHNSFVCEKYSNRTWNSIKDKWLDAEFQVESFIKSIEGKRFLGETFPVYWPNLGPNVFAAFYGAGLEFDNVTSWAEPCVKNWEDINCLRLNMESAYFKKIEELTQYVLERCEGKFMVKCMIILTIC